MPQDSPPQHRVLVEKDVPMTTRDGLTLRADVYRPDAPGRFPVLLSRLPYNKNLRPRPGDIDYFVERGYGRSASVIDRLLKNQNPLENRNNLRSSSPHPDRDRHGGNRAAILRSEIHRHGSHGCSDRRCSVRAFDEAARRSAAAASRGPRLDASRAGWRLR